MKPDNSSLRRDLVRGFLSFLIGVPVFSAFCLFLPAGTLAWRRGWLLVIVFTAMTLAAGLYLCVKNPEVAAARARSHQGTKIWDKFIVGSLFVMMTLICVVGALDDGRFHWSAMPTWVCGLGYFFLLLSFVLFTWAEAVNKFFEPTVRIQTDRGHKVIDSGPYATIRHPGYVGGTLMCAGVALCLGSWWALIPAAACCLLLVVRTLLEERTLKAELSGYDGYMKRVRYRWIPGVW